MEDFPDDARFLSDQDRVRVLKRLKDDQQSSASHEDFKMSYMWDSLRDWKTWVGMLMYMGVDGNYVPHTHSLMQLTEILLNRRALCVLIVSPHRYSWARRLLYNAGSTSLSPTVRSGLCGNRAGRLGSGPHRQTRYLQYWHFPCGNYRFRNPAWIQQRRAELLWRLSWRPGNLSLYSKHSHVAKQQCRGSVQERCYAGFRHW